MFTSQIKSQLGAANLHSMRVAKLTLSDFTRQEEIQMLYNIPLIGFFFFFFVLSAWCYKHSVVCNNGGASC